MTGHDFLDIGTGGFADTNYPVIIKADYTQTPNQEAETVSQNGGRVFYVTTDQDGNFRVGDYFKVEQATGRATLSSEEFDLTGLNELQLGSITAGKTGATINEFSTDPNLTDISDNAVPTEGAVYKFVKSGFMGTDAMVLARGATSGRNMTLTSTDSTTRILSVGKSSNGTQGTGAVEVTQDGLHGGGISYNGDGTPGFVSGEGVDHITFYRMSAGTRYKLFSAVHNSNDISFTGTITAAGDVCAYSDASLKTNVQQIDGALDKVSAVRGVTFDRIADGSTSTGVIAQELEAVLPEAVQTDANGVKMVAYGQVTGLLVEAIKELKSEIAELKAKK